MLVSFWFGLVCVCVFFCWRWRFCYFFFGGWIELGEAFVTVLPEHKEKFKEAPKARDCTTVFTRVPLNFCSEKIGNFLFGGDFVWWQAWQAFVFVSVFDIDVFFFCNSAKDLDTWTQLDTFETTEKCLFLASILSFFGDRAIFQNTSGAVAPHALFDLQVVSKMVTRIDLNGSVGHQWHHVSRLQRYRQGLRWGAEVLAGSGQYLFL